MIGLFQIQVGISLSFNLDIPTILIKMLEVMRAQIPEGKPYNSKIRLYPTTRLVHVNLISGDRDKNRNIPNDEYSLVDRPYRYARQLVIQNRGPGDIRYDVNQDKGSTRATIRVKANEGDNWEMNSWPVIHSLNFVLDSPGDTYADVEFILMV
jgi:hypothetical protein